MSVELLAALIAAGVALLTAGISNYLTWKQTQRERTKWLTDLKSTYAVELYKARLGAYPVLQELLGRLSWQVHHPLNPDQAHQVAQGINQWVYSTGGLITEADTRKAILGLRNACIAWTTGEQPDEILEFRNIALFLLRRDLDVYGLGEEEELRNRHSLLERLRGEIARIEAARR
jgi:hypothetical protein